MFCVCKTLLNRTRVEYNRDPIFVLIINTFVTYVDYPAILELKKNILRMELILLCDVIRIVRLWSCIDMINAEELCEMAHKKRLNVFIYLFIWNFVILLLIIWISKLDTLSLGKFHCKFDIVIKIKIK